MRDRPGAKEVEAAAKVVFDRGWVHDDSVFTPGRGVWTPEHVDELYRYYVKRPDESGGDFMTKFRAQLEPVSDEGRQLAAELLYLNLLPLADYYGSKKREIVNLILGWCSAAPDIPPDLNAALERGIFNGGVAFKTRRWQQLALLVEIVRQFKYRATPERAQLLRDPWAFRDFIRGAEGSSKEPAQRNSLLYLGFPEYFMPIVNTDHRKRILKAFSEYVDSPTADNDRDLYALQEAMNNQAGAYVDFYQPPYRDRWLTPAEPETPEETAEVIADVRHAWLVRGSSVRGRNLVPQWLAEGFVSLPASRLPAIEPDLSREALKSLVDEHYSDVSYNQRQQKFDELFSFLGRMSEGDVVATTSQGRLYVGRVTGDASYLASPESLSNVRRPVDWRRPNDGTDYADLPPALAARLQSQHDVIDLTQQIEELEGLLSASGRPAVVRRPLTLPDASEELASRLLVTRSWLQECVDLLRDRPQLIFYGPPGTGKTYLAQHLAWHLAGRENTSLVQFHPAYSYEDFFEGYRPVAGEGGTLRFELHPGPLRRIVDQAREHPESPYVLIIDEINRGNLAKIFGELYFLLEYRDQAVELLYSSGSEQAFTLPPNVFIVGTMNTADRSIALIDSAMRRRFAFVALIPSEEPVRSMLEEWLTREGLPDTNARLLDRLNQEIEDPDFKVGPSYLMRRAVYQEGGLDRVWRTSILPLLEEHHYGEGVDVSARYGLARLQKAIAPVTQDDGTYDALPSGEEPDPVT